MLLLLLVALQFTTLYLKNRKQYKCETLHTGWVPLWVMQSHVNFSIHCLVSMETVTNGFMQYIIIGSYFCMYHYNCNSCVH